MLKKAGFAIPAFFLLAGAALSNTDAPVYSSFNVTPLRIELDGTAQFSTFQVRNDSSAKMAVQARGFAWDQSGGEDRYAPTADIAISPSIVEIEPGATQHFKLIRRRTSFGTSEASYRLVLDQLPDGRTQQGGASNTLLRVSIPVFIDRNAARPAQLAWSANKTGIRIANSGGRSVKFGRLAIATPDGRVLNLAANGPRYVLSGAAMVWALPGSLSCLPEGSVVTGTIDNAPLRQPVPPSCE
jgi:fimbrial chaperone protein